VVLTKRAKRLSEVASLLLDFAAAESVDLLLTSFPLQLDTDAAALECVAEDGARLPNQHLGAVDVKLSRLLLRSFAHHPDRVVATVETSV
jgi:hypothetical protein